MNSGQFEDLFSLPPEDRLELARALQHGVEGEADVQFVPLEPPELVSLRGLLAALECEHESQSPSRVIEA